MRRNSPVKHLYRDAVVWVTATINGLRLPPITTSNVGIESNRAFISLDKSRLFIPLSFTIEYPSSG